jgi:hypothetical protein
MGICMSKSQQPVAIDMAVRVPTPTQPSSAPPATLAQVPSKPHYNERGDLIRTGTLAERTTLNSTIIRAHVKQLGMPTFNEVHSCFSEVRAYYKEGVKSSNKFYYPLQVAHVHQGW